MVAGAKSLEWANRIISSTQASDGFVGRGKGKIARRICELDLFLAGTRGLAIRAVRAYLFRLIVSKRATPGSASMRRLYSSLMPMTRDFTPSTAIALPRA